MDYIALILIAVSLAMDAFAVAITGGITIKNVRPRHAAEFGLMFGGLQFAMPIAGFFLGSLFSAYIESIDHWIAFALLVFIGGKMLLDTFRGGKTVNPAVAGQTISPGRLFLLGIATSIDALAVGVSIALTGWDIWVSALVIGIVAFALSYAGVMAGKKLGLHLQKYAGRLGGLVLIVIGVKILLEHLLL
ncbi:MAG: manganese efflux pump MntP family protein [Clostridiales bacterium]|nr:manganese efflux pump MntP family protein [Clostridiales bacterium]